VRSEFATKRMETNMRAQAVVRVSRKSGYALMLLSALLAVSLAVNGSIIVLAGGRL